MPEKLTTREAAMGKLYERLKDMVGIMDDAGDFSDRIEQSMSNISPLLKKIESMSQSVHDDLKRAEQLDDAKEVKRILDGLDIDKTVLAGHAVNEKFARAVRDLRDMERSVQRLPPEVQLAVRNDLQDFRQYLNKAVNDNLDMINLLGKVQEQRSHIVRKLASGSAGIAVGVAASSFLPLALPGWMLAAKALSTTARVFTESAMTRQRKARVLLNRMAAEYQKKAAQAQKEGE